MRRIATRHTLRTNAKEVRQQLLFRSWIAFSGQHHCTAPPHEHPLPRTPSPAPLVPPRRASSCAPWSCAPLVRHGGRTRWSAAGPPGSCRRAIARGGSPPQCAAWHPARTARALPSCSMAVGRTARVLPSCGLAVGRDVPIAPPRHRRGAWLGIPRPRCAYPSCDSRPTAHYPLVMRMSLRTQNSHRHYARTLPGRPATHCGRTDSRLRLTTCSSTSCNIATYPGVSTKLLHISRLKSTRLSEVEYMRRFQYHGRV